MYGIGMTELLVVLAITGLLFGAKRIPEIGRSLGASIREFKNAGRELRSGEDLFDD